MTGEPIPYNRRGLSASAVRDAIAADLEVVKRSERLSDEDIGDELGKSIKQARLYRLGEAEMSASTYWRGVRAWGPEFGRGAAALAGFRLVATFDPRIEDQAAPMIVGAALMKVLEATKDGTGIDAAELRAMRPEIDALGVLVDALRSRDAIRSVAA